MRERQRSRTSSTAIGRIERELDDKVDADRTRRGREAIETVVAEAEAALAKRSRPRRRGARSRRCCPARPTATTPISKSMPAPAAPRARTGPRCCCACIRAGPSSAATRSSMLEEQRRRRGRHQVGDPPDQGRQCLWLAEDRVAACIAWCASRPSTATRGGTRPSPASGSIRWSTTASRSTSRRPTCASTPIARRGAGGQHVNTTDSRGAHHPHADRHRRRVPERALAAQEPRQGLGHAARAALRGAS